MANYRGCAVPVAVQVLTDEVSVPLELVINTGYRGRAFPPVTCCWVFLLSANWANVVVLFMIKEFSCWWVIERFVTPILQGNGCFLNCLTM